MKLVLYSTGCPMCKVLKTKLAATNLPYTEINDQEEMIAKGFKSVPVLEVDGKPLTFKEAVDWMKNI